LVSIYIEFDMLSGVEAARLIRRARLDAGLTQAELADRIGTSQAAVARLERPGANPRLATLARAVAATGKQLRLDVRRPTGGVDEAQIARQLRLTPAERAAAHDSAYAGSAELVRRSRRAR
jgi:transcriptional regulator with XRE-family HTH domain